MTVLQQAYFENIVRNHEGAKNVLFLGFLTTILDLVAVFRKIFFKKYFKKKWFYCFMFLIFKMTLIFIAHIT